MDLDLKTRKHDRDAMLLRHPPDELGSAITVDLERAIVEMGRLKNLHRDALAKVERLEQRLADGAERWKVLEEQRDTLQVQHQHLLKLVEPYVRWAQEVKDRDYPDGHDLRLILGRVTYGDLRALAEFVKEERDGS